MKVGTDGVLLGAWADVSGAKKILDVGTGTGVIALMMAQRSEAEVTAIEIDKDSYEEACFNFSQSPWPGRIRAVNSSFYDYCAETTEKFSLIISNPPFFENVTKASDQNRSYARHTDLLPYRDLISGSFGLLEEKGKFTVIIPVQQAEKFIPQAQDSGLYLSKYTNVRPKPSKPFHRILIEFSKEKTHPVPGELTIETNTHHNFTSEYKNLTKDFYLNF